MIIRVKKGCLLYTSEGGKLFEHMPGQCAMVCAPGVSEGMFSITSSPTNKEYQAGEDTTSKGPLTNFTFEDVEPSIVAERG